MTRCSIGTITNVLILLVTHCVGTLRHGMNINRAKGDSQISEDYDRLTCRIAQLTLRKLMQADSCHVAMQHCNASLRVTCWYCWTFCWYKICLQTRLTQCGSVSESYIKKPSNLADLAPSSIGLGVGIRTA